MGKNKLLSTDEYLKLSRNYLASSEEALLYLKSRNVTGDQVKLFNIGYTLRNIEFKGFEDKFILKGFLTFPMVDHYGELRGFIARNLSDPDSENAYFKIFFDKTKDYFFGINLALPHIYTSGTALLVEGNFDLLSVQKYFPASLAMQTVSISKGQEEILLRYASRIIFLSDDDKSGNRSREVLAKVCHRLRLEYVTMRPKYGDPSNWEKEDPEDFRSFMLNLRKNYIKELLEIS